jgi:branched-chain amino acid aminotransferase
MTHGLHYGSAVFEGIRAYETKNGPAIFGLREHVKRLFHSCRIVHLPLRWTEAEVEQAICQMVRENGHSHCYIRPLAFRGYGALGVHGGDNPVELVIATFPWGVTFSNEALAAGIDVCVSSWRRMAPDTHPAMAKSAGNYVNSQLIVHEARALGFHDGLALDVNGYVAEGSGQNLFLVRDGKLYTPPIGSSILAGFTRHAVLSLAQELSIPIREQLISREMLYTSDEAFLTGTVAELTPIRSVDRHAVGIGRRGPITERIQQRFFALVRREIVDRHQWLTLA